jgi:tRNA (uracil-5-)-methyltransferase TRM9
MIHCPSSIETTHVLKVYDHIATHFSDTRNTVWDGVQEFLNEFSANTNGFEIGCGNGKNMIYAANLGHYMTGIDTCSTFIDICRNDHNLDVHIGTATVQTYVDCIFDYAISIAVFHHLSDEYSRIKAMENMINILKVGGRGLVSVWAVEQEGVSNKKFNPGDNLVKWNKPYFKEKKRYFEVYERYYYIYTESMFRTYMDSFKNRVNVDKLYYQKGNWFCEFTKMKEF